MRLTSLLAVLLTALTLLVAPVQAQEAQLPDYNAWEHFAQGAEKTVAEADLSEQHLAQLRQSAVDWRGRFQAAQNVNANRIATTRDQIAALGPAPAEGETEDADVAARRATLNEQLTTLQAPRVAASEAFSRADALVRQIDELSRERQATALARLSPSPLLPASWAEAAGGAQLLGAGIAEETRALSAQSGGWWRFGGNLPTVLGYLVAGVAMLGFGRRWVETLPSRLGARTSRHSLAVVAFLVSLGQIVIPLVGVYLVVSGLDATGNFGDWTRPFLKSLPAAGVMLFGGRWLMNQCFPTNAIAYDTLTLPAPRRNALRRLGTWIAALFAVHHVMAAAFLPLSGLYQTPSGVDQVPVDFPEAGAAVWHFALIVPAALLLFRAGNILRRLHSHEPEGQSRYRARVLSWAGTIARMVSVVAILAGAAGFIAIANALLWPFILTLALILLLVLLQDFVADLFEMFTRGAEGARDGLGPVLIGFALIVLSTPLFLLIWGARPSDIKEYWLRFMQGASLGGITISPGGIIAFLVVFAIGYSLTRAIQGVFRNTILPKTRLDGGGQNAVVSGLGYIGIFLAAVVAITSAGIDLSSLAIVAGALSVGIGFGLQNIVSNFVSGIILLIERPISVGEWIQAAGQQGIVKRISVRSTTVETFDKTEVIVPNADLVSQPVTNWTRSNSTGRIIIPVGVAYGTDTRRVEAILREIIEDQPLVTINPAPAVLFRGFGADSMDFEIRAILSDVSAGLGVTSEVLHQIAARFAAEEIEIPFAQRDIWLRNPETLRGETRPADNDARADAITAQPAPQPVQRLDRSLLDLDEGGGGGEAEGGGGDR